MINEYFDAPWKVKNAFSSWCSFPIVKIIFSLSRINWGKGWKFYGVPIVQKHKRSEMHFGENLQLRSTTSSNPLGANHRVIICTWQEGAVLDIGSDFGMTGGSIVSAQRIKIGNRVTVGANTTIIDTDFHPTDVRERQNHPQEANTAAILINDDVFIGMNCLILKGVTIGEGSVVGAGSVVVKDVPAGVIVAGNPAVIIRNITE
jgi:acetyltransferase-like isoleucine patch superfamily enzyme